MTKRTAMADLESPPVSAPEDCVDPLMWQLARQRFDQHGLNDIGRCVTCGVRCCPGTDLAREGLATAMGVQGGLSAYWTAFARVMRNPWHAAETA
ncbi:hypothetical protein AB0H43_20410 [Hamadaea sp. NPDC050747]|uniref:hypothetical protein n=1 Tax=Hamadaea sp. NPDC050747 TaxID=3155789 RepID=UPI003410A267